MEAATVMPINAGKRVCFIGVSQNRTSYNALLHSITSIFEAQYFCMIYASLSICIIAREGLKRSRGQPVLAYGGRAPSKTSLLGSWVSQWVSRGLVTLFYIAVSLTGIPLPRSAMSGKTRYAEQSDKIATRTRAQAAVEASFFEVI